MKKLYCLIVIISLLHLSSCQHLTAKKQINLQKCETFVLELDQLFSYPISNFTWPDNLSLDQVDQPYQRFDEQAFEGIELEQISHYYDGSSNIQYYLDLQQTPSASGSDSSDFSVIYYSLQIERNLGVLQRTDISNYQLLSNASLNTKVYASFYNKNSGFITYSDEKKNTSGTINFEFTSKTPTKFDEIPDTFLNYHASREYIDKDSNSQVFLICPSIKNKSNLLLLKYNSVEKTVKVVSKRNPLQGWIFVTYDLIFSFDHLNYESRIENIKVDYQSQRLLSNEFSLPAVSENRQKVLPLKMQKINDIVILSVQDKNSRTTSFIRMNFLKELNQGELVVRDIQKMPFMVDSTPSFIDDNNFVVISDNTLKMVNLMKKQITYQIPFKSSSITSLGQQLNNQFLLYESSDSKSTMTPIKLQTASLTLTGIENVNYNLRVQSTISEIDLSLEILINVSSKLVPTFSDESVQKWKFIPQPSKQKYSITINEDISGINLHPSIISNDQLLEGVAIQRITDSYIKRETVSGFTMGEVYQVDGMLSTLIVSKVKENEFKISAPDVDDVYHYHESTQLFDSPIQYMDNYGTFITTSSMKSPKKQINLPLINRSVLEIVSINNINCSKDILFASDQLNNVIFILCESKITYIQYNISTNLYLSVISTQELNFDFSSFNSMICIKGKLFVYSDSQIVSYNYMSDSFGQNTLQIPQLSTNKKQKVILFSDSFLIIVQDDPVSNISQYSYGDFMNTNPVYLRKLFIDEDHPINPDIITIQKRNEIEYLYIASSIQNEYVLYRMNQQYYSQNQLAAYANIYSKSTTIPIISSNTICQISIQKQLSCQKILDNPVFTIVLNINETSFYSNLIHNTSVTLEQEQYKQLFNFQILRLVNSDNGLVNQTNNEIQRFRTFLQDQDFKANTTFEMDDHNMYSSCLSGWRSGTEQVNIYNRMQNLSAYGNDYTTITRTIMYNMTLNVTKGQITIGNNKPFNNNNITLDCIVLDDQASINSIGYPNNIIDIYVLCPTKIITLMMNYTIIEGNYDNIALQLKEEQNLSKFTDLQSISRIIKFNQQLWLYDTINSQMYKIVSNIESGQKEIVNNNDISSPFSINIIESIKIYLNFYQNGVISYQSNNSTSSNKQSITSLQMLLNTQGFYVEDYQSIDSIFQIEDNRFRVQFHQSFIFEMAFDIDLNNQLIAKNVYLFYHEVAVKQQTFHIVVGNYTVIIGVNQKKSNVAILFDYSNSISNHLLFESAFDLGSFENNVKLTTAELIEDNQIILYFSNGNRFGIKILKQIAIEFKKDRNFYKYYGLNLKPIATFSDSYEFKIHEIPNNGTTNSTTNSTISSSTTFSSYLVTPSFIILISFIIIINLIL